MTLSFVKPTDDPNVNFLLYGEPKTGKTIGAASAPGPLLFLNADRPNATRIAHSRYEFDEVAVDGLETLIDVMHILETGEYRTVVLDTVAETYRVLLEELSGRALNPSLPNYGDAGTHLERFIRKLWDTPVNSVLVAHAIAVDTGEGVEELPFVTTKSGSPVFAAKLLAGVDVFGYTGIIEGEEGTEPKYVAQLVSGKGRRGGDRSGALGYNRELDLTEWVELVKEASAPVVAEKEGAAA